MPGFTANGLGSGPRNDPRAYYKYTWEIEDIFWTLPRTVLIYAKECTLPSWDFEKDEVMGASLKYKFAKSISFNDVKITWYDVYGIADIIKRWRGYVWTPADGLLDPNNYKSRSHLKNFTYDMVKYTRWTLFNSWPQSVKSGDLTYTDSDIKLVEVTVAYDWAEESEP
jgi:hypothetical protein